MTSTTRSHEKHISRQIHRLFWEANAQHKWVVIINQCLRIPAQILFHVLLPVQIAIGIEAIVTRHFDDVSTVALRICAIILGYVVLWSIGGVIISRAGAKSNVYLQEKIFRNFLSKDYDFYTSTYFGALGAQAARIRDAFNEYNGLFMVSIPKQAVVVIAGLVVIGWQSPIIAFITLIAMLAVLSFTILTSKWRLRYRRQVGERGSEVSGIFGDTLTQAATVKSFAAEDYESSQLRGPLQLWARSQYLSWVTSVPADAGRAVLAGGATIVLLLVTARLYQDHTISIAVVALVQLYVVRLITSTQEIAEIIKAYETTMGGAYQPVQTLLIATTINDKPTTIPLPTARKLSVEFKKVTFRYEDAAKTATAVKDFSLAIAPGEKVGLVGFSGSGKTTLTKLLLRFMDVTSGSIHVQGINISDASQHDLRQHISFVPQEPLLFHRSILDNIAYGKPQASTKAVRKAAAMAHMDDFINELPAGYDTMVGERGIKLSGGQRQRVAIARAILKDAPILVLDEATSALDSQSEHYIQEALWNLMKDRTALVIAHRLSTIQRLDRIVVMDKGHIMQVGTHEQLLADTKGTYAKLWAHQSGGYITDPSTATESTEQAA